MPKFCPNCGKDITDKVKFCPECGVDINSYSLSTEPVNIPVQSNLESGDRSPREVQGGKKMIGVVSNVNVFSSVHGSITTNYNSGGPSGHISTNIVTTFRVNNYPCRWDGSLNISEGDLVTVAGVGSGELTVYALHNKSTSIIYSTRGPETWRQVGAFLMGGVCVLFGLDSIVNSDPARTGSMGLVFGSFFLLLGLCSCGFGLYLTNKKKYFQSFKKMVDN
jgi:hypothetical protein